MPTRYGIALGSNLGDRLTNLREACARLWALHSGSGAPLASPVYETDPVDCEPGTEAFLNAVVEIESALEPAGLIAETQKIEQELRRPSRRPRNAPRTIDVDILYADDFVIETEDLQIPHPRLRERRFVLRPLADIRPDLRLPGETRTIEHILNNLQSPEPPLRTISQSLINSAP